MIAALVALMVSLRRSALGIGGGRAATCGESASADNVVAEGAVEFGGITIGDVSPRTGEEDVEDEGTGCG